MSLQQQELIVREHERLACRLHAVLRIDSGGVVLSGGGGADGPDTIPVTVVDCSGGGAGLQTSVFLPRGCRAFLSVAASGPAAHPSATPAGAAWALEAPVRLQRVAMISREPLYYLGAAFADLDGARRSALAGFLAMLRGGESAAVPEGGGRAAPR